MGDLVKPFQAHRSVFCKEMSLTEVRVSSADTHNAAAITPNTAIIVNTHVRINGSSTTETGNVASLEGWDLDFEGETPFVFGEGTDMSNAYSAEERPFRGLPDSK